MQQTLFMTCTCIFCCYSLFHACIITCKNGDFYFNLNSIQIQQGIIIFKIRDIISKHTYVFVYTDNWIQPHMHVCMIAWRQTVDGWTFYRVCRRPLCMHGIHSTYMLRTIGVCSSIAQYSCD